MSYTPTVDSTDRYATVDIAGERFTYPVSTATIAGVAAPIAGNNLLKASNNFSDSSWTKTRSSVGATTSVTLTSGESVTMTKIVEDGTAANTHRVAQASLTNRGDLPIVARLLVKQSDAARNGVQLVMYGDAYASFITAVFNVEAGSVTSSSASGAGVVAGTSITAMGDGAYLCILRGTVSVTANSVLNEYEVRITNDSNTSTYNGDSTSGVYIAQAQLTEGTEATTYQETTTERISGDGQRLTHSGDLSNAAWSKTNVTGVSAGAIAYTNAATLDTGEVLSMAGVYETVTNSTHRIFQTSDISATVQVIAKIRLKQLSDRDYSLVRLLNASSVNDYVSATIRFSTGAVHSSGNAGTATGVSASIENLGDGVYELTLGGTPSTTAGSAQLSVYCVSDAVTTAFAGDVTKGVYIADPIIVAGSTAPSYTRSYADRLASGGSTRDRAYVQIPHIDDFDAAGIHIGTRWNTEQEWILTDGTDTATSTEQIAPPDAGNFGSAGIGPYDYAPSGVTPGDDAYIHVVSGTGVADPADFSYSALTSSVIRGMAYDLGTFEWLPYNEETFTVEGGTATGLGAVGVVKASLRRGMI